MKAKAAILRSAPGQLGNVTLDVDEPRQGELLVKMVASGLCHSDDHVCIGDIPVAIYPFVGGHEGAGTVEQVGPDTPGWELPVAFKREKAQEFDATESFSTTEEATGFAQNVTDGQGADSAIVTVGATEGEHVAQACASIRKAGTVVVLIHAG